MSDAPESPRSRPNFGLLSDDYEEAYAQAIVAFSPTPPQLPPDPLYDRAKLESFARKRGFPVGVPGWETTVLLYAAAEHKELKDTKRGRPRKEPVAGWGLLSTGVKPQKERTEDEILRVLERIQDWQQMRGQKSSQAEAARQYAEAIDGYDPKRNAAQFESRVKTLETLASRARTRRDRSKRKP